MTGFSYSKMQVVNSTDKDDNDSSVVVKRLSVPLGLEELMESLTKQVLQKKPRDVYSFASDHFAKLLELRDKSTAKNVRDPNLSTPPKAITLSDSQANILSYKSAIFATAPNRIRVSAKQPRHARHEVRDKAGLDPKVGGGAVRYSQTRPRRVGPSSVPISPPALVGQTALLRRQQQGANDDQLPKQRQQQDRKARVARQAVDGRRQNRWEGRGQSDETPVQAPVPGSSTERRKQYDKELHNLRLRRTQIHSSEESIAKSDNSDSSHVKQIPTDTRNNTSNSRARPSKVATIRQTESFEVLNDDIFIDGNNITLTKNDMPKKTKTRAAKVIAGTAVAIVPSLILNQSGESNSELENDEQKNKILKNDANVGEDSFDPSKEIVEDLVDKIDPSLIDSFDNALTDFKVTVNHVEDENKTIEEIMNDVEAISLVLEKESDAVENGLLNANITTVEALANSADNVKEAIESTTMVTDNTEKGIGTALSDVKEIIDSNVHSEINNSAKIMIDEIVADTTPVNVKNDFINIKAELDNTEKKFEDFINNEPAFEIVEVPSGELEGDNKIDETLISGISNDDTIGIDEIDRATQSISSDTKLELADPISTSTPICTVDDKIKREIISAENIVESHSKKITPYLKKLTSTPVALLTPDQISPRNENNESNVPLITASVVNTAKNIISGSLAAVDDEIAKILLEYNEKQSTQFFLNKEVENYKSEKSDVEYTYIPLRDYSIENDDKSNVSDEKKVQSGEDAMSGNEVNNDIEETTNKIIKDNAEVILKNVDEVINKIFVGESLKIEKEKLEIDLLQTNEKGPKNINQILKVQEENIIRTGIAEAVHKIDTTLESLEVNKVSQDTFFGKEVSPRATHEECLVTKSNRAATQIQSAWRGHRTRKTLARRQLQKTEECDELPEYKIGAVDALRAATTIQAFLRGHLVRKALRQSNTSVIDSSEKCHILEEILEESEVEDMAENTQKIIKLTDEEVEKALTQLDAIKVPETVNLGLKLPTLKRSFTIENQKSADKEGSKTSISSGSFFDKSEEKDDVANSKNEIDIQIMTDPDILDNKVVTDEIIKDVLLSNDAMKQMNDTVLVNPVEINNSNNHSDNTSLLSLDSPSKDENTIHYEMAPTRPLTSDNTDVIMSKLDSQLLRKSLEIVELTTEENSEDLKLQINGVVENENTIESGVDASGKESELSNRSCDEDVSVESQDSVNTVIMAKDYSARLTPESDVGNILDEIDDTAMDVKESLKDIMQSNMGISPLPMDINEKLSRYNDLNIRHDVENSEFIEEMSNINIDSELQLNLRNSLEHENNNSIIIQNENNGDISEEKNIKILTDIISAATKIQSLYRGYKVRAKTYTKPNGKANIGIVIEGPENNNNAELENKNKIYDDVIAKIEAEQYEELEKISGNSKDSHINRQLSKDSIKDEAATMIQKHYKGYRARRDLAGQATIDVVKDVADDIADIGEEKFITTGVGKEESTLNLDNEQENVAAAKIQKHYKKYKANCELTEQSKNTNDAKILESSQELSDDILDAKDKILQSDQEENVAIANQKHYRCDQLQQAKDELNQTEKDNSSHLVEGEIPKECNNKDLTKSHNMSTGSDKIEMSNEILDIDTNTSDNPSIQQFIDSIIDTNTSETPMVHPVFADLKNTEKFIETCLPRADNIYNKREEVDQESSVVIEEVIEDDSNDDKEKDRQNDNVKTMIAEHQMAIHPKSTHAFILIQEDLDKQIQNAEVKDHVAQQDDVIQESTVVIEDIIEDDNNTKDEILQNSNAKTVIVNQQIEILDKNTHGSILKQEDLGEKIQDADVKENDTQQHDVVQESTVVIEENIKDNINNDKTKCETLQSHSDKTMIVEQQIEILDKYIHGSILKQQNLDKQIPNVEFKENDKQNYLDGNIIMKENIESYITNENNDVDNTHLKNSSNNNASTNAEDNTTKVNIYDSALKSTEDVIGNESEILNNVKDINDKLLTSNTKVTSVSKTGNDQELNDSVNIEMPERDDHVKLDRKLTVVEDEVIKEDVYVLGKKDDEDVYIIPINGKDSKEVKNVEMKINNVDSNSKEALNMLGRKADDDANLINGTDSEVKNVEMKIKNIVNDKSLQVVLFENIETSDGTTDNVNNVQSNLESGSLLNIVQEENDGGSLNKSLTKMKKPFDLADLHNEIIEAGSLPTSEEIDLDKPRSNEIIEVENKENLSKDNNNIEDLNAKNMNNVEVENKRSTAEILQAIVENDQVNNDNENRETIKSNDSLVDNEKKQENFSNKAQADIKTVVGVKENKHLLEDVQQEHEDVVTVTNTENMKSLDDHKMQSDCSKELILEDHAPQNVQSLQKNGNNIVPDESDIIAKNQDKAEVNSEEESEEEIKLLIDNTEIQNNEGKKSDTILKNNENRVTNYDKGEDAAITIQKHYKDYKIRKNSSGKNKFKTSQLLQGSGKITLSTDVIEEQNNEARNLNEAQYDDTTPKPKIENLANPVPAIQKNLISTVNHSLSNAKSNEEDEKKSNNDTLNDDDTRQINALVQDCKVNEPILNDDDQVFNIGKNECDIEEVLEKSTHSIDHEILITKHTKIYENSNLKLSSVKFENESQKALLREPQNDSPKESRENQVVEASKEDLNVYNETEELEVIDSSNKIESKNVSNDVNIPKAINIETISSNDGHPTADTKSKESCNLEEVSIVEKMVPLEKASSEEISQITEDKNKKYTNENASITGYSINKNQNQIESTIPTVKQRTQFQVDKINNEYTSDVARGYSLATSEEKQHITLKDLRSKVKDESDSDQELTSNKEQESVKSTLEINRENVIVDSKMEPINSKDTVIQEETISKEIFKIPLETNECEVNTLATANILPKDIVSSDITVEIDNGSKNELKKVKMTNVEVENVENKSDNSNVEKHDQDKSMENKGISSNLVDTPIVSISSNEQCIKERVHPKTQVNDPQNIEDLNTIEDKYAEDINASHLKQAALNANIGITREILKNKATHETNTDDKDINTLPDNLMLKATEEIANIKNDVYINRKETSEITLDEEQLKSKPTIVDLPQAIVDVSIDTDKTNEMKQLGKAVDANIDSELKIIEKEMNLNSGTANSQSKNKLSVGSLDDIICDSSKVVLKSESKSLCQQDKSSVTTDENKNIQNNLEEANNESESKLKADQTSFKYGTSIADQGGKSVIEAPGSDGKNRTDNGNSSEAKLVTNKGPEAIEEVTDIISKSQSDIVEREQQSNIENKNLETINEVNKEPKAKLETHVKTLMSQPPLDGVPAANPANDKIISVGQRTFSAEQQETFAQLKSKSEQIESQLRNSLKEIEAFTTEQLQEPFYLHEPKGSGTTPVIQNNPIARVVQIAAGTTHTTVANIELLQTAACSQSYNKAMVKVQEASPGKPLYVNVDSLGDAISPVLGVINPEDIKDGRLPVTLQLCQDGASSDADGPPGQVFVIIQVLRQ